MKEQENLLIILVEILSIDLNSIYRRYLIKNIVNIRLIEYDVWKYIPFLIQKNRKIVVSHLGEEVPISELFTSRVLTNEILHRIDDEVIRPNFELPSQDENTDIDELVDSMESI